MHDHFFILDHYHYYHYFLSIIIINLIIMRKDNSIFCPFESGFIANLIIKHCFFFFRKIQGGSETSLETSSFLITLTTEMQAQKMKRTGYRTINF